jgi:dipeptidyl aminopeptidase/acylaminoacyl peptidase
MKTRYTVPLACLALAAAVHSQVPNDPTSPRIALNQEAKDVETKLELLQQELYMVQQQLTFLTSLHDFEDHMKVQRVMYPSGKELVPGYIFSPRKLDSSKKYPGLILVHGGFHSHLDWRFFDLIDYAVNKGYVVMFPEYHGSSGYGDQIFKNNYGTSDVADVLAATDYLVKSHSYVDAERLAIYGHSRGGMVTLLAIERAPTKFKAAVDVAGLVDFLAFMAYKPDWRRQETAADPVFGGKLPAENLAPYMEITPLNHVDKIQSPLFIAATTGDKTVPLTLHTGRLVDALKARNKVHEVKIYDMAPGDHLFLFGDTDERRDLFQRTFAFLERYLKP